MYRDMNRATLDAAYDNARAVGDFDAVMAEFRSRSCALYEVHSCRPDLRYGPQPRQRYDWIPCDRPAAGTLVFLHGGYWQACAKEDFAFVAEGPLARGYNVVLAEYTLAPQASMSQIVAEVGELLDHLAADRDRLGLGGLHLCGHSAGGHLTAVYRHHPAVMSALLISALVDLEPISLCWLDEKLQLTPREIDALSPLRQVNSGAPTLVAVGAGELPELVRHSTDYAMALEAAKEPVGLVHVPGRDHFSILDDLARPESLQLTVLADLIEAGRTRHKGFEIGSR